MCLPPLIHPAGKPGKKRDVDGNEVPQKRSKAAEAAAAGGEGDAMDVSLPSPTLSAPARPGERVWHSDEHTVFVKGMGFQVKENDLRQLFDGLAIKAVRMGLDRETGQARVSGEADAACCVQYVQAAAVQLCRVKADTMQVLFTGMQSASQLSSPYHCLQHTTLHVCLLFTTLSLHHAGLCVRGI